MPYVSEDITSKSFLIWLEWGKLTDHGIIISLEIENKSFSLIFKGFQSSVVRHRQTFCGQHPRHRDLLPAEHLGADLLPLQRGSLQTLRAPRQARNLRSGNPGSGKFYFHLSSSFKRVCQVLISFCLILILFWIIWKSSWMWNTPLFSLSKSVFNLVLINLDYAVWMCNFLNQFLI